MKIRCPYPHSLLFAFFFTGIALADDTEIYGAAELSLAKRVNANILFIADTSGSMSSNVSNAADKYDSSRRPFYSGSFDTTSFYLDKNANGSDDNYDYTRLDYTTNRGGRITGGSCATVVEKLASTGRAIGWHFYQKDRNGDEDVLKPDNASDTIYCSIGSQSAYLGNYLNWKSNPPTSTKTRLRVVENVVYDLVDSVSNVNMGLMRFDTIDRSERRTSDNHYKGGMIDVAVDDIANTATQIKNTLGFYDENGGTPLSESLYEAALYFKGENVWSGLDSYPSESTSDSWSYNGSTKVYDSPIAATCQRNFVILLTDGAPTVDTEADSFIESWTADLIGKKLIKDSNYTYPSDLSTNCSSGGDGACLDELAYYMKESDFNPVTSATESVTTYTISGFGGASVSLMNRTAKYGGGKNYSADNYIELEDAFDDILQDIISINSSFTAPAVSVNAFNNSEHRDELYYALFKPEEKIKWQGNLKKYRLFTIPDEAGSKKVDGVPVANDVSEGDVISLSESGAYIKAIESTGFFNENAVELWNSTGKADGNDVSSAGAANTTNANSRKIYTSTGNSPGNLPLLASLSQSVLQPKLNVSTNAEYSAVRNYALGKDDNGNTRFEMGDPLHSEPTILTYGGTESNPDAVIFISTNEGYLHAIDTDDGSEVFSYIPDDLLPNLKEYYDNTTAAKDKPYGLDGFTTLWVNDQNQNGRLYTSSGSLESSNSITEHAYLYVGMRRGGNNYYALDVTNREQPKMLFTIKGGTGDFSKLGQTWSPMTPAKVPWGNKNKVVIFFTGGYDTQQDSNSTRKDDSVGNIVYMVDAATGELLWSSDNINGNRGISDMTNSIPSGVTAIDINGDGLVNYMFVADTGGRVFRIDINKENNGASDPTSFAKGGLIADLAVDSNAAHNRRFYNKPNVSIISDRESGDYLTIALGSGHRAHPVTNNQVADRFYVIKDMHPYEAPSTYTTKTEASQNTTGTDSSKVYDATNLMLGTSMTASMQDTINQGGGFYIRLTNNGEKVLAESVTNGGAIIFTTFAPSGSTDTVCGPDTGQSRMYAISQRWAQPIIDLDGNGVVDSSDGQVKLSSQGIAPRPVIIYGSGGSRTIAAGRETFKDQRYKTADNKEDLNDNPEDYSNAQDMRINYWKENNPDFDKTVAPGSP